jgi:cyanophycin synthetase
VVRLQLVPAATTGGDGRAYFDSIHPDNRRLAERAAQFLRLDIAGVDMITPDITRSWREVGGAVTEINALPQVSIQTDPTMFQRLLQKIMPHSGRIPLLFVLTEEAKPVWLDDVLDELEASGLRVGLTTTEGLQVGNDWIRGLRSSVWEDIRLLQKDPSVGAIVIISDGDTLLQTGLPFDAVNALVVQANRPQVLSLLMPYVSGVKLEVGQDWQICSHGHDAARDLTQAIVSALLQAESEYGKPAHL